jgi:hypothetical protein
MKTGRRSSAKWYELGFVVVASSIMLAFVGYLALSLHLFLISR